MKKQAIKAEGNWQEELAKRTDAVQRSARALDEWPLDIAIEPLTTFNIDRQSKRVGDR